MPGGTLMNRRRPQSFFALLCSGALLALFPLGAHAQSNPTHTVKKGETLVSIAEQYRPPEATVNQMALAMVRANANAFQVKGQERLTTGTVLTIPNKGIVMATNAAAAEREFSRIWKGEQHYKAALALEKSGHMFYAFATYVEAAKLGHALAQLRVAQLYDSDFSGFVRHDLQESAAWYEKARQQGVKTRTTRRGGELEK